MSTFEYVSVLSSVVVGLAVVHLLQGLGNLIQHPGRNKIYWVHLVWVFFVFFAAIFWWWFEFALASVEIWDLKLYLFVLAYAVVIYLMSALLFPGDLEGYAGFEDYFYRRRGWIFGCIAMYFLVDFADTWLKGPEYVAALGLQYPIGITVQIVLCGTGIYTRNRWFHGAYAIFSAVTVVGWAFANYATLR
jgi:hypothetical protein